MDFPNSIGGRIRFMRRIRDRTQSDLAEKVGISVNALTNIERGNTKDPHASIIQRIARELHVSADFLLCLSVDMGNDSEAAATDCLQGEPMAGEPVYSGTEHTGGSIPCREI